MKMKRARTICILITSISCFFHNPGRPAEVIPATDHPSRLAPGPVMLCNSQSVNLFVDDDYTPATPGYGTTHFSAINDALLAAGDNDLINLYDGIYAEVITISSAVVLAAIPGENPVLDGTGMPGTTAVTVAVPGVSMDGLTIRNYDYGIVLTGTGTAEIVNCRICDNLVNGIQNQNADVDCVAGNCWWGAPSGPSDYSDDRGTGGLYNPGGLGNPVSDHVLYYPWSVNEEFTQLPVEFGIFNTACGALEVRLKPLSGINSTLTMLTFTVRWAGDPVALETISSPGFNLELVNLAIGSGGFNYAVFGSDGFVPVEFFPGEAIPVLTFSLDGNGSGFSDFEIATDSWTVANNANPYLELMGTDYSGAIYHNAPDVYMDDCENAEFQASVLLDGPYDSLTNLMRTDIQSFIPLNQPYNFLPWMYTGSESLTAIPAGMVDWVLVELRSTPAGPPADRNAGILMNDGKILDAGLDGSIRFDGIVPSSPYYVVIHHRNHFPVMSRDPVIIPNPLLFDFSDTLNFPPYGTGKKALVSLENGVSGMIPGDINNDGRLKYSGPANDRGLIMNLIYYVTGEPVITQTIEGYYKEDLTMNRIVKYSGPNNDAREIVLSLVELTGSTALNSVFQCVVPGSTMAAPGRQPVPPASGMSSQYADIGIFEHTGPDELVIRIRPDHDIPGYGLTNIQFTLRWPETSSVYQLWPAASPVNSTFNIQPQGPVTLDNGYYHQIFAAANNTILNWTQDTEYPVLVLKYLYSTEDCTGFEITEDAWTVANNGTYYFEVIGQNRTGILYQPEVQILSEGGSVNGSGEICLGSSTGIMILASFSGDVARWQRSTSGGGTWSDIPGTSGITSYSETPPEEGSYMYRAEVVKFGCSADFSAPATIDVMGDAIWTGNTDSNWNDPSNWNVCGVPTISKDVIIPDVSPKPFPVVNVTAYCKSIRIQSGATLTVSLTGSVIIGNNTP